MSGRYIVSIDQGTAWLDDDDEDYDLSALPTREPQGVR